MNGGKKIKDHIKEKSGIKKCCSNDRFKPYKGAYYMQQWRKEATRI